MLFTLESNLQLWEQLQEAGMKPAQEINLTRLRAGIIYHAIWFALFGLLSIVSSVGLFRLKEWARKLWLGELVLLAGISFYWLVDGYHRDLLRREDVVGYLIIAVIIGAMWHYFTRRKIKDHFQGHVG